MPCIFDVFVLVYIPEGIFGMLVLLGPPKGKGFSISNSVISKTLPANTSAYIFVEPITPKLLLLLALSSKLSKYLLLGV